MQKPIVLFVHSVDADGQFEVETAGTYRPDLERCTDRIDANAFEIGKWHAIYETANGSFSVIVLGEFLPEQSGRKPLRSWHHEALKAS